MRSILERLVEKLDAKRLLILKRISNAGHKVMLAEKLLSNTLKSVDGRDNLLVMTLTLSSAKSFKASLVIISISSSEGMNMVIHSVSSEA
jgi:hypothetical protein